MHVEHGELKEFAARLRAVLHQVGWGPGFLSAKIEAQHQGVEIEGVSEKAIKDYLNAKRPPKPPAWNAIRLALEARAQELSGLDAEGELLASIAEADRLHEIAWTVWVAHKGGRQSDASPLIGQESRARPSNFGPKARKLLVAFTGYGLFAALLVWTFIGGQAPRHSGGPESVIPPSVAHKKLNETSGKGSARQPMGADFGRIDAPNAGTPYVSYDYELVIPNQNKGNAFTFGIARADDPLELLHYRNGVPVDALVGKDVHVDFTDDGSTRLIRVRNWGKREVGFVKYFLVRRRG